MANDLDELIQEKKRLYDKIPDDSPDKQVFRKYIEKLETQRTLLNIFNNLRLTSQGRLEFTSHVLSTCLKKTNQELDEVRMKGFIFYLDNRDKYPDEYKEAKMIFEKNLRNLNENILNDIITGLESAK